MESGNTGFGGYAHAHAIIMMFTTKAYHASNLFDEKIFIYHTYTL